MNIQHGEMVANWIQEEGNPAIEKLTELNLQLSEKVSAILLVGQINKATIAEIIDAPTSEVDRWLVGLHNFSEKILTELSKKLTV